MVSYYVYNISYFRRQQLYTTPSWNFSIAQVCVLTNLFLLIYTSNRTLNTSFSSYFYLRGKTVVHWQSCRASPDDVLWQLCCLNDRFALDGLSPPSYGGVLWCFGWGDKAAAGNKVSTKWSYRYRTGPDGFELAKERIFSNHDRNRITGPISSSNISATIKNRTKRIDEFCDPPLTTAKKARRDNEKVFPDINTCQKPVAAAAPKSKTILSFFSPKIKTNRAEL